ncbi:McbB family protein [Peribacillus sp. SCS-26]|uniref:McbB family protein n=1 Tax=Paraperibacillus marinus TaxID=3115295 RepID=UPI003905C819
MNSYEKLKIKPFIMYDIPEGGVAVQHASGIFRVFKEEIICFLRFLNKKTGEYIGSHSIFDFLQESTESALIFLVQNNILVRSSDNNLKIQKINFFTNEKIIEELVAFSFKDRGDFKIFFEENQFVNEISKNRNELFFVYLPTYNKAVSKKYRDYFMKNTNTFSMISYIYNNNFYIDSMYSSKWKLPCHLCNINLLEAEHRIGIGDRITYQQILDDLFDGNDNFQIEMPLTNNQKLNLATQMSNRIEHLINCRDRNLINNEDYTKGAYFEINTNQLFLSNTHHWELCDCYE